MLGFEVSPVVQYVIAFAIIAALLGLFAIVLRRIGGKRFSLPGQDRGRGRQPRLGIVDVYDLDRQRQLVLLRRDNVEHLVMLGGPNDLVVESNIVRVPVGRAPATGELTERLTQAEPSHEPARPQMEPAIAASAGVAVNGMAAREQAHREQAQREQAQREQAQREQALREQAQREQAQREQAQREQAQREASIQQRPLAAPAAPQPSRAEPVQQPFSQPSAPHPVAASQALSAQSSPTPPAASPLARPVAAPPLETAARSELKSVEPVVTAAPPPPPEPRRGLFGFGRAVEPSAPMPAFPSRPRATPVAPDFAPQRMPPKFAPAVEEKPAAPPVDTAHDIENEQDVVENSAEISAEKPSTDGMPQAPEKTAAAAGQPKPGRALDDAILSDMTRQLEAALRRPGSATQPSSSRTSSPQPFAVQPPSAPTLDRPARAPEPPAAPPADAPSEPKLYKPVATAAAAAATVAAVASVFRSSAAPAPSAPSNPVPPRPYGGADEAPPAISTSKDEAIEEAEVRDEPEKEAAAVTLEGVSREDGYSTREQISGEQILAEDAPAEDSVESSPEAATQVPTVATAASDEAPSEIDQDDRLRELPPETIEPVAVDADESASSMQDDDRGEIPDQAVPAAEAEDGVREVSGEPSEEAAKEASETGTEQRKEPTPVIDPFSVDEIEAEFARLLGRSVDKDPKNP